MLIAVAQLTAHPPCKTQHMDMAVVTVNYLCLVPALPCIRGAAGISTSPCGAQLLRTYRSYYGGTRARPHISLAHGDGSLFPRSGME
jgi:hypothetical protein